MSNIEFVKLNMQRSWRSYEVFLILITVLESLMMIYGVMYFDFRELRRKLYFILYVLLFCCTVAAFVINRLCLTTGAHDRLLVGNVYVYSGLLIFWSAAVSGLDMGNGGYPVTYMTILAAVGSMTAVPPVVYGSMAVLSSAGMIAMALYQGAEGLRIPFYMNHLIFLLVIIAVEVRNYRTTRNQYLLDKRLEELAEIDSLTQVSNRRSLDKYMARLVQEDACFTFSLLDVDDFKVINDTYGHLEGDLSLIHIASLLTQLFGGDVFRYGGDEFAVISFEGADAVAEKMAQVNLRLKEASKPYPLHICAGLYQRLAQDSERRVFERADSALYRAKQTGKARAVVFEETGSAMES